MKKIFSILVAVLLLCTLAVPVFADENAPTAYNAVGEGTSGNPWQISTLAQLENLADAVNGGNNMEGKYIVLTADIDGFTKTIGYWEGEIPVKKPFKGHFDGKGHTVTLNINATFAGLFGAIDSGAEICNVNTAGSVKGSGVAGGICSFAYAGTISNCSNSATVTGSTSAGGICGWSFATITNCYNSGEVGGGHNVGAICGIQADGSISNCYYDSTVYTGNAGGGIGLPTYLMQANPADTLTELLNSYIANNPDTTAGACKWEATKDGYPRLVPATAKEDENGLNTGSALSEGNMTIIIAIAAAVLFGLGGFFAGNAFSKKKKLAPAAATSSEDDE